MKTYYVDVQIKYSFIDYETEVESELYSYLIQAIHDCLYLYDRRVEIAYAVEVAMVHNVPQVGGRFNAANVLLYAGTVDKDV